MNILIYRVVSCLSLIGGIWLGGNNTADTRMLQAFLRAGCALEVLISFARVGRG